MRPSQTILVLDDVRNSSVRPLHRKGIVLSDDDTGTVLDVYQQWLLLMIDLGFLHPGSLFRDALRLWQDIVRVDVLDLNNTLAELLGRVRNQDFKGFKALCALVSTHLYPLIKDAVVHAKCGDVISGGKLIQLFSFTSRLSLNDIDLTQECLDAYLETERLMPSSYPEHITSALNNIIKRWMESFDPARIQFSHGPGGVAGHGRCSIETKYKDLTSDALLTYAFGEPWWQRDGIRSTLDRISQTIFVPKSYKTFRTISMESSTLQYCQQGVLKEIDRVIEANRFLRSHMGMHDQPRNQRLAKEGSLDRTMATIDLSAASDSVSYELVKRLFRGTKVLRYLVSTRSKRTYLPDHRLVTIKKFAPMGSALCFPVETLIFGAICDYVTRGHGVPGNYSVYGDDIIVPTQCVGQTMRLLETLGFRVNRDKSFYHSSCWFRESCGAEYCSGYDVTPMRVSRKYSHKDDVVRATAYIDLANKAYARGYKHLRYFYLRRMRLTGYMPLFSPMSVWSDNYTNYHTRRRWNENLQRIECEVTDFVTRYHSDCDESIRLRHWYESTSSRLFLGDGFHAETRRPTVFPKIRWMLKPYESPDQAFIDFFTARG